MKTLFVYTSPKNEFDEENVTMSKLQIDNCLELGWKIKDIILLMNFPFEYRGVKATIIPYISGGTYDSNKIPAIVYAIENKILEDGELYWYHDFDAYQLEPITEKEVDLGECYVGLTIYNYKPHWNLGVFFFTTEAYPFFKLLNDNLLERVSAGRCDEKTLWRLFNQGLLDMSRIKTMNARYNITMRDVGFSYYKAKKPLIMLHFHPYYHDDLLPDTLLNTFMYGTHYALKKPLMNKRLIALFHKYGIK